MSTLVLDATTKTIQAVMAGAAATSNPDFVATYADNNGNIFTEAVNDGAFNGTTPVTLVTAPASGYRRIIKKVFIENKDTAPITITINFNNNGTLRTIIKVILNVGDTWTTDGTYDTYGNLKQTLGTVNLSTGAIGILPPVNGGSGVDTITGIIKGNGTSPFTAAVASTDYAPPTSGSSILYGNGSGGFSNATIGSGIAFGGGALSATGSFTGSVEVLGTSASAADIKLGEDTDSGTNYVSIKAPQTLGANLTFVLPATYGETGQALVTDGAGNLSFGSAGISTGKAIAMAMIFGF